MLRTTIFSLSELHRGYIVQEAAWEIHAVKDHKMLSCICRMFL